MKRRLEESLRSALAELEPADLVRPHLPEWPPALILSVGKAALEMLSAARAAFPGVPWLATPPRGHGVDAAPTTLDAGRGWLLPGSHPLPDEHSVHAAETVLDRVSALGPNDDLLLLVSGGGSALWCAPRGVSLAEKRLVVDHLLRAGADIFELNAVRKHLSRIKGGRLAAQVQGRILGLVISDVPGDDLSFVASGVAAPSADTFADALAVLDKYGVRVPAARDHLQRGVRGEVPASPGRDDSLWQRVENRLIGSNRHLLEAAKRYWERQGYKAVILSDRLQGEARDVARAHALAVRRLGSGGRLSELPGIMGLSDSAGSGDSGDSGDSGGLAGRGTGPSGPPRALGSGPPEEEPLAPGDPPADAPLVLLSGGEATVTVKGSGRGGRNQEFALW